MRTLLIASQKGGVGKTTTAVNLSALAARGGSRVLLLDADPLGSVTSSLQLLRTEGDIVPRPDGITGKGAVWANALPGVDVVSPYPDDDASDDRLQDFTTKLPQSAVARFYDLVVIDAPPMMGPRPKMLLQAADDVIIVQRAEPMSFRTLPTYLSMLRDVKNEGGRCQLRGILMTLPAGMAPGSKAVTALREKFKGLLGEAIPFAPEVNQALVLGQPIVESHPDSVVAKQYRSLAITLGLATADKLALVTAGAGASGGAAVLDDHLFDVVPKPDESPSGLYATKSEITMPTLAQTPMPKSTPASQDKPANTDLKSDLIWLTLATVAVLVTLAAGVWLLSGGAWR